MTSIFHRQGQTWTVSQEDTRDIHKKLPVGVYTLGSNIFGYYLDETEAFKLPSKMYGKTSQQADRILNTFQDRPSITGVLLEGEKGSGKTLLAKQLAVKAAAQGIPTIIVNNGDFCGDPFNQFMQSIDQPCLIFFDEFEKVYDAEQQQKLLTFLDGVFPTKKLCVLTVNDRFKMDQFMMNRPGRIFYMLSFDGLDESFVREYAEDRLNNKEHVDGVTKVGGIFRAFNFDQLQALVEEMNRYGEAPLEALKLLNVKPESDMAVKYDVELTVDGNIVDTENYHGNGWVGNPIALTSDIQFVFDVEQEGEESEDADDEEDEEMRTVARFSARDFRSVDPRKGMYLFVNKLGDQLRLTRQKVSRFEYPDAF